MNDKLTEIVFLLDRSGSMGHLTDDTIGGYNAFIKRQQELDGDAKLTTILFDDKYEILHDRVDIHDVNPITILDYSVRGSTAMLDAIGHAINDIGYRLNKEKEDDKPSKVIFVITTDGLENASSEYSKKQIKEMITEQTEKYSWEFIFLGANIDAVSEAESIGIRGMNACNYVASSVGTDSLYNTVSKTVSEYRSTGCVSDGWSDSISCNEAGEK